MSDEATASDLVTEPAKTPEAPIEKTHEVVDPAATVDPAAAALDPAKAKPKAKRVRKPRAKAPSKKAAAKKETAATAREKAGNADEFKAAADEQHRHANHAECVAAYAAAMEHLLGDFAALDVAGPLVIRLASSGAFVPGEIAATFDDFQLDAGGMTYAKPIDIGPQGDPVRVDEVWVLDAGTGAVRCDVGPLSGGGGAHAQIPAKHTLF